MCLLDTVETGEDPVPKAARTRAPGVAVLKLANARKGPWRIAGGPLNNVLNIAYWEGQGLIRLIGRYRETRNA